MLISVVSQWVNILNLGVQDLFFFFFFVKFLNTVMKQSSRILLQGAKVSGSALTYPDTAVIH